MMQAGKFLCIILLMSAICSSCHSVRYVPVETVKHDTAYFNKVQRDSIYLLDSVFVREKGDTVYLEKYRYLYRDKLVRDTLYITKTDSVSVPYPVEKELTKWEQVRISVGGYAIVAVIVIILIVVGYMVYKLKKGG